MEKQTYTFTLVLTGFSQLSQEVEDALFLAGCDDALLGIRDGVPFLDFDREASSLKTAVLSAIKEVKRAGYEVVRIEPDELVTASEIANRTRRSRESIRLLISGKRGKGGFPPPVSGSKRRTRLWRWSEVADWMETYDLPEENERKNARFFAAINGALDLSRYAEAKEGQKLLTAISGR